MMKVLLLGGGGQVGGELRLRVPPRVQLVAPGRRELDITDGAEVAALVREIKPAWIINAAAYTAVDRAEEEREQAFAVNAGGPELLARAARTNGAGLIQLSTDFVFAGDRSSPYRPDDHCRPLGVYGASKLEGERRVLRYAGEQALIVRTSWLYAAAGANFVATMLRLMGEREELGVVADQVGTPTWARGLVELLWRMVEGPERRGIYHFSDAGVASWYDFAVAIQEEARRLRLLEREIALRPLATAEYPTKARRPPYSVLDKSLTWRDFAIEPRHWRVCLREMLQEM